MAILSSSLCPTSGVSTGLLPPCQARLDLPRRRPSKNCKQDIVGLRRELFILNHAEHSDSLGRLSLCLSHKPSLTPLSRVRSVMCSAALNARCATEGQTQTVEKPTSVITNAPGKEKSPQLDDGGTGFPPRDDDGGGGGGGGGGGNYSGGFFFFGFLAFLGFLKDKESEGPYQDSRRRSYD